MPLARMTLQDCLPLQGGDGQYCDCDKERAVRHPDRPRPAGGRDGGRTLLCRPGERRLGAAAAAVFGLTNCPISRDWSDRRREEGSPG